MVETSRDLEFFLKFRANPGEGTLLALLRGNQDRIYNICFQVLRHPQDAEDAAQEVLLELTEGCSRIQEVRAFRSWLYRVSLHTAMNHKKARFARAELARRSAAMTIREDRSKPDEDGSEVVEAIARLDDESRCLILEHYFEKTTLEDLARREGLSVAGIWKRIERAKGMLRRALIGAGFTVSAASLSHALEAVAPVSAPASLIGGAVVSKAALVAAGGFVMASKSAISGTAVALAVSLLTLGAGSGYWVGSKRAVRAEISESGKDSSNPNLKTGSEEIASGRGNSSFELSTLRALVQSQERAIKSLKDELATSKKEPGLSLEEKLRHAALTYLTYKNLGTGVVDEAAYKRAMALFAALDSDMGPYFAQKYKESAGGEMDHTALTLGLSCGGGEMTDLILERFNDPNAPRMELNNLCRAMSGIDGWLTSFDNLVMNDRVRETAERLLRSENPLERRGGAGMLGIAPTQYSEQVLKDIASNDANGYVRAAALKSLGRVGGADTVEFLRACLEKAESGEPNDVNMKLREAGRAAMEAAVRRKALGESQK